jgi:hypothetical protein
MKRRNNVRQKSCRKKAFHFPFVLDLIISESRSRNADSLESYPINTPAALANCHPITSQPLNALTNMDSFASLNDVSSHLASSQSEDHETSALAVDIPVDSEHQNSSPYFLCVIA